MSMLAVATNIAGLNTHRNLKVTSDRSGKASEKLATGYKINRAGDDAAGLAISEKMRNQIKGLNMAQKDVEDGISLIKTAESGMQEISEMIGRQRELTIQAMNDTNTTEDRAKIQEEIDQLTKEIDGVANKTEFNGVNLLNVPEGTSVIPGGTINLTVQPGESVIAGYIDVKEGQSLSVWVDNFTQISGAQWPDLNITAPNGDTFGYSYEYLNGSAPSSTNAAASCQQADYNGFGDPNEKFDFTNVTAAGAGRWKVEIKNTGGNLPSQFDLNSNLDIIPARKGDITIENQLFIKTGANEEQNLYIDRYDCRAKSLGVAPIIIDPIARAEKSLNHLDRGLERLLEYRANAGAQQNRLEHTSRNLGVSSENLSASESRIRDTDMAKEMMEFTKSNILSQAGMSMQAQANQQPNQVLSILK